MLPADGLEHLRVAVQLFPAVRQMHQRHHGEQHPLITGGEVIQHLTGLPPLLLQIVGHHGGEIIVAVLPALPVGDVGLHPQQAVLHLPHRLIRGHRDDVNGQHEISVEARELVDHGILDIAGILLQEQDPAILLPHDEVILPKLHAVRTDGVFEGSAGSRAFCQVQPELRLLPHPVEIVEDTKPLRGIQFLAAGIQMTQAGCDVIYRPVKKSPCLLQALSVGGEGDIALLHHAVGGIRHLTQQHGIVLRPFPIQAIPPEREQNVPLKVSAVETPIVDGDLGGGAGIQCVQQLRVAKEHRCLVLLGSNGVIDVTEAQGLGILAAKLKDPIRP